MPELVDVLVDEQILLDVGVRGGDVCLRLVVVVVADEVLDRVVREQALQLAVQLGCQSLVVTEHQRGLVRVRDEVRHRERLSGAGRTEQHLMRHALIEARTEARDGLRLVARGLEGCLELKPSHLPFLAPCPGRPCTE